MIVNFISVEILLYTHVVTISLVLLVSSYILARRGLFRWTTAGFWAWVAFLLYFVLHPLASLLQKDIYQYKYYLDVAGGVERGWWILFVAGFGIIVFFIAYLNTKPSSTRFKLNPGNQPITLQILMIIILFMGIGFYSLLTYRASLLRTSGEVIIEQGRFVGTITGYETVGYLFLYVPILFLMLSSSFQLRWFGVLISLVFLYLSLPHAWSRYATVSMVIAIALVDTVRRGRRWPRLFLIFAILVLAVVYQVRSHTTWTFSSSVSEFAKTLTEIPDSGIGVLASADTAMLPTWYVDSYLRDTLSGYDYGLPVLNYIVSGWIPNRIFPEKYFLIDALAKRTDRNYPEIIDLLLYGAKPTLVGSFYEHGGWLAVMLLSLLTGFLCRKLDGWLLDDSPQLLKAVGISWMSVMWMIWGSHDYWGVTVLGAMAIPAIALWLISPKFITRQNPQEVIPMSRKTIPYM